jgi:lipopolysaccharide/colanic/teichoic acid biosynthesis glycosyltransferase
MNQETVVGLPGGHAVAGGDRARVRRAAVRPTVSPDSGRATRRPPAGDAAIERSADAAAEVLHFDDLILPRSHFLREVHREKRRADRSRSPLSVLVFRSESDRHDEPDRVEGLLEILRSSKRETDVLGDLGECALAMILPDTNAQGLEQFVARVNGHVDELRFSLAKGTYPDDVFEDLLRRDGEVLRSQPLYVGRAAKPRLFDTVVKRGIDIVGSALALAMLSPVMLIVAVAIASTSPGPVIFRQKRLGKGGRPFVFYKFRSMAANADDRVHREYVTSLIGETQTQAGPNGEPKKWAKLASDARITPVGRFLRKTSLDELPQFYNVLKGDLSLVGPRPALPYEAEKYQSWHLRRILEVKPGISGLWQVAAGYEATFDDMVRLDIRYIRERSLLLDLKILFKTVQVVLRRNGTG